MNDDSHDDNNNHAKRPKKHSHLRWFLSCLPTFSVLLLWWASSPYESSPSSVFLKNDGKSFSSFRENNIDRWIISALWGVERGGGHAILGKNKKERNNNDDKMHFVWYPHKRLEIGQAAACHWWKQEKQAMQRIPDLMDMIMEENDDPDSSMMDWVQENALYEGVCVPSATMEGSMDNNNAGTHVFSSKEAKQCLQDVTVAITGDNDNKDLYIALGEIVLEDLSNIPTQSSKQRAMVQKSTSEAIQMMRESNPSFPNLVWICDTECKGPSSTKKASGLVSAECSHCINSFHAEKKKEAAFLTNRDLPHGEDSGVAPAVVVVTGATLNLFNTLGASVKKTIKEIKLFLESTHGVIYTTPDASSIAPGSWCLMENEKKNKPRGRWESKEYRAAKSVYIELVRLARIANKEGGFFPLLDFFQMTRACTTPDCCTTKRKVAKKSSSKAKDNDDSSNASRHVNRWKAQLLLNMICDRHPQELTPVVLTTSSGKKEKLLSSSSSTGMSSISDAPLSGQVSTKSAAAAAAAAAADSRSKTSPAPKKTTVGSMAPQHTNSVAKSTLATPPPPPPPGELSFEFVPFPHKKLPVSAGAGCSWTAKDPNDLKDKDIVSLLGRRGGGMDSMQKAALEESICLPTNNMTFRNSLHLFSAEDAKKCLTNITLAITGDSYNRLLSIGMTDILLSRPDNLELYYTAPPRNIYLNMSTQWLAWRRAVSLKNNTEVLKFPDVQHVCYEDCVGRAQPFWKICSDCLKDFKAKLPAGRVVVPVIGASVHIFNAHNRSKPLLYDELDRFFRALEGFEDWGVIYNSPPSYHPEKVPVAYREATKQRGGVYWDFLPKIDQYKKSMAFLDYYQLTQTCHMENCSFDGGHRARFVNRWKAQLLLNMLCSVSSVSPS